MNHIVCLTLTTLCALPVFAGEKQFQVFSSKSITPGVERFYGKDGTAFANIFCNSEAKIVMIVDSRLPDLDGKNFQFTSFQDCIDAREQSRSQAGKCKAELIINTDNQSARFQVTNCQ
ncbi:MAG: hypothetical protein HUU57_08425 [Bdellovibrio sp.]|nr:hypothetical protein [Bdellovibrio sp.]